MITRRAALSFPFAAAALRSAPQHRRCEELRRVPTPEANQAVAADQDSLYAIGNHTIGRYDKKTGKRLAGWECENGKPLIHLDSGVVHDGVLYCAHSNYPGVPMVSSIETWDAATLRHTGSYSFGIFAGSATWVDLHKGWRYVTFAHYKNPAAPPATGSISGHKYRDITGNGLTSDDTPLSGTKIYLDLDNDGVFEPNASPAEPSYVTESAPIVRPANALSSATKAVRLVTPCVCQYRRANLRQASLASVPLLQKKVR